MELPTQLSSLKLLQLKRVQPVLYLAAALMVLVSILLIAFTIIGYGTLQLANVPSSNSMSLNGHTIKPGTLKLRPGDYVLTVTAPSMAPFATTLHISLFRQTVEKPILQPRSTDAIASSLIGAIPGTSIPPHLANLQWFDGNMWVAGTLPPTDSVLVMKYNDSQQQWTVALCNNPGYPNDPTTLPSDVAAYIQPLLQTRDAAEGM